jgi:hypothetical protein
MSESEAVRFAKHTEMLVSPRTVGGLYKRAEMLARLPVAVQKWIVANAPGADPYIGFVVEPYCSFLAYEITDVDVAGSLLPPHYQLAPAAMFDGASPKPCAILGAFNVHTSVFWGGRVELYVIAENTNTGMMSWVIVDYESNTISYDPGQGFSGSTTRHSVITTTFAGEVVVDVESAERPNSIAYTMDLDSGSVRPLEQRLWIEGNLSVDYGGRVMDEDSEPFGLIFQTGEMAKALEIPVGAVTVDRNTFGVDYLANEPFEAAVFPYAQHFMTTSFPRATPITDAAGLERAAREMIPAVE